MRGNVAARLGGWSTRHRKAAIIGWLLFVVAATLIGGRVGQETMADHEFETGESAKADQILDEAGIEGQAGEMVLLHTDTPNGWSDAADAVTDRVNATGEVENLAAPLVSDDGRDALIQFDITGDSDDADERIQPVLDAVNGVKSDHPEVQIDEFGDASANKWFDDVLGNDFKTAEYTAVPVALGILLVVFGAFLAALLPIGLAMTAFIAANGLLALTSHALHVTDTTSSVMLLMGLAVGVDYCLFYLRRERDERAAGRDPETALRVAAATSGRAVLVSGLTVIVAMAGMFFSGLLLFQGLAVATIMVVFIAMLGSVTVLPALLSLLGDKVDFGRIPLLNRRRGGRRPTGRIAGRLLRPVLARPGLAGLLAAGALVALALPALGMRTESLGIDKQVPKDTPIAVAYQRITEAFPGGPDPAHVVIAADDIDAPEVTAAVDELKARVAGSDEFTAPVEQTVHQAENVAVVSVPLAGSGTDDTSRHALDTLRDDVVPDTLGPVAEAHVTGSLASSVDFNDQLHRGIVPVFLFVIGVAFVVMLVSFRSVVVAVTSILLNMLSIAAAYGALVAIFQHGWGSSLIGTEPVGAIESWLPLFILVVLFGLSMDYHVFVVSRIREFRDQGMSTRAAVGAGIRATSGSVTGAAAIMVAVFSVFATLSMQDMKQLGAGLAIAVLLDATLIRMVLLPSLMALLGEANWYLPRWLRWLPRMSHGSEPEPGAERAPIPATVGRPG